MKNITSTLIICLITFGFTKGQNDTMYIYKQGGIITKIAVNEIDSITFNSAANNIDTNIVFDTTRKILVEDYTGHQCGSCPPAAEELDSLISIYGNQIVPLAIHAGFFAAVNSPPLNSDFRTTEGTTLDTYFGISIAGNPNGMINRIGFPNSNILNINSWQSVVSKLSTNKPDAVLSIENIYNSSTKNLETNVYAKFLNNLSGNHKLCVYLTEDSIVDAQKDYSLPTPSINSNYVFNRMLRSSFNGTWGEALASNPKASSTFIITKKYSMNLAGKLIDINHPCNVVAFIYNDVTKEIVQASFKKIK